MKVDVITDFGHVAYVIDSRILPNVVQARGENEDLGGALHQEFVFWESNEEGHA